MRVSRPRGARLILQGEPGAFLTIRNGATMPSKCMYRIAPSSAPALGLSSATEFDGFRIEASSDLPLTDIRDSTGGRCAVLVGHVFDPRSGAFITEGELRADERLDVDSLERFIDSLSGGFIAITSGDLGQRLYLDPGGNLPIVYRDDAPICASSVCELLDDEQQERRIDRGLIDACIAREGIGAWIGGYITAHRGVMRLLPNHYLDLKTSRSARFWPREEDVASWRPMAKAKAAAATALDAYMQAAARRFPSFCALTAGKDTRLLLAASRHAVKDMTFFTVVGPAADLDLHTARLLARRFGLKHQVVERRQSSEDEAGYWDRRVGFSIFENNRGSYRSLHALGDYPTVLTGMYGEVGRCRLYRQNVATINRMTITERFVLDRLTLPQTPQVLASVGEWLDRLKGMPPSIVMDLAYLELRSGAWAMGQRPATSQVALHLSPMAQRAVLEAFVLTDPVEKTTSHLFEGLIRDLWTEVMDVPVNAYGDMRDQLGVIGKLFSPNRLKRFLRDRLAKG